MLLPQLLPWDPVTHPALTPVHHQPMRRERRRPSHESITSAVCKEVVTDATSHRPPDIGSYLAEAPRLHVLAAYLRHEAGKHNGLLYIAPVEVVASRTSEGPSSVRLDLDQRLLLAAPDAAGDTRTTSSPLAGDRGRNPEPANPASRTPAIRAHGLRHVLTALRRLTFALIWQETHGWYPAAMASSVGSQPFLYRS